MRISRIIAGLLGAGFVMGLAPAFAGEWRLDQRRCSSVVESRYDQRDYRPNSRATSRSDSRWNNSWDRRGPQAGRNSLTVCSRSAFVYVPDRWEQARTAGPRSAHRARTPQLRLTFDRRVGLPYTAYRGQRVYIRG